MISFPIEFRDEVDARTFVRKAVLLFEIPCYIVGNVVHLIVPKSDFDAVLAYASSMGGRIQLA